MRLEQHRRSRCPETQSGRARVAQGFYSGFYWLKRSPTVPIPVTTDGSSAHPRFSCFHTHPQCTVHSPPQPSTAQNQTSQRLFQVPKPTTEGVGSTVYGIRSGSQHHNVVPPGYPPTAYGFSSQGLKGCIALVRIILYSTQSIQNTPSGHWSPSVTARSSTVQGTREYARLQFTVSRREVTVSVRSASRSPSHRPPSPPVAALLDKALFLVS